MDRPQLGADKVINPYASLEREFRERCREAGIEAREAAGDAPVGLRGTIFALAWKSAIANYGGPHGGEFPIRIGLDRGQEDRMVVTEIRIGYSRLQGDLYMWRCLAKRRSVPQLQIVDDGKGGKAEMRVMVDGVSSESNYRVQEIDLEEGFRKLGGRASRYTLGLVSDSTKPEQVCDAVENVKVYTVTVYREDRQRHVQVFKREETPVIHGIVHTLLGVRAKDLLDEPMECPGIYPDGYVGGTKASAVRTALQDLSKSDVQRAS